MLKTTTLSTRAILGAIGAGGLIAAATLAPSAHADTLDPHISNPTTGWCPCGGAGGLASIGFCVVARYPDGSYWHLLRGAVPFAGSQMRMDGVVDEGSTIPRSPRPAAAGVRCE